MAKKGISVWILSSLTFIALAHLIEAIFVLVFNNEIRLLQFYPFINEKLQMITPIMYLLASAGAAFILWGMTCAVVFTNPVETFLSKILSDTKTQTAVEAQLLEEKGEILDVMNETIESNSKILAQVNDLVCNVITEVKGISPLNDNVEKIKTELNNLKKEVKKFEEKIRFPVLCPTCGKTLSPELKTCPFCGEKMKLEESIISTK